MGAELPDGFNVSTKRVLRQSQRVGHEQHIPQPMDWRASLLLGGLAWKRIWPEAGSPPFATWRRS